MLLSQGVRYDLMLFIHYYHNTYSARPTVVAPIFFLFVGSVLLMCFSFLCCVGFLFSFLYLFFVFLFVCLFCLFALLFCICLSSFYVLSSISPVSLDCPFLIVPLVLSSCKNMMLYNNVYYWHTVICVLPRTHTFV